MRLCNSGGTIRALIDVTDKNEAYLAMSAMRMDLALVIYRPLADGVNRASVWAAATSLTSTTPRPRSGQAGDILPWKIWLKMSMLVESARLVRGGPKMPGGLMTTKLHLTDQTDDIFTWFEDPGV